jgi:uncharacterized protein YneF (UPF0154 family)
MPDCQLGRGAIGGWGEAGLSPVGILFARRAMALSIAANPPLCKRMVSLAGTNQFFKVGRAPPTKN